MKNNLKQMSDSKQALRKLAISKRKAIRAEDRRKYEESIRNSLFALQEFRLADKVLFYASFREEVNTEIMIVEALDMGKTVALPKVNRNENRLTKHVVSGLEELSPGHMGIPEPPGGREIKVEDIHMLVIPGLAFDTTGARIGFGGGYYDRLLHRIKGKRVIAALAFEAQIFDKIPDEPHDIPVDYIITEQRTIDCHG